MDVDVARVAKREPGMNAVEVMTSESQERMLAIVEPDEPRRGARAGAAVGDPRDGRRARHRHRALPRLRRLVRRGRRARREPAAADRRRPARGLVRRAADRRRSGREPRRRSAVPPARWRGPPRRTRCRPPIPAPQLRAKFPAGADLSRRAARAARDADDRRQDLGVAPVRPPAVPEHGRRARAPTPRCCA